jgi:hypothetical protein
MNSQMLLGGFGGPELILIAAIALLLAAASRFRGFSRAPAQGGGERAGGRAYLDQLIGPARRPQAADSVHINREARP